MALVASARRVTVIWGTLARMALLPRCKMHFAACVLDSGPPSPLRSEDSPTAKRFKEWYARQVKSFVGISACASDTVVISESEDDEQNCYELGQVEDEQDCNELSEVEDEQNSSAATCKSSSLGLALSPASLAGLSDEIESASDAPEKDPVERVLLRHEHEYHN